MNPTTRICLKKHSESGQEIPEKVLSWCYSVDCEAPADECLTLLTRAR